jgi:hypothetical protein
MKADEASEKGILRETSCKSVLTHVSLKLSSKTLREPLIYSYWFVILSEAKNLKADKSTGCEILRSLALPQNDRKQNKSEFPWAVSCKTPSPLAGEGGDGG